MEMNTFMLLLVSLPEAFLNLMLILLFAGQKNCLKLKQQNIIKFCITLVLMLVSTWFIRPLAPNIVVNTLCTTVAYIVIFLIVYRLNVGIIALSVTSILLYILAIENTYIPFVIAYHAKNLTEFFGSNLTLLLCSIPERVLQVLAIALLWKYNEALVITSINKKFRMILIPCNIIIFSTEEFFSNIFVKFFNSFSFFEQIIYAVVLLMLILAFNTLIFAYMYIALKGVMILGFNRYQKLENKYQELEDNAQFAFDEVYQLLKNNNTENAVTMLEELLGKK